MHCVAIQLYRLRLAMHTKDAMRTKAQSPLPAPDPENAHDRCIPAVQARSHTATTTATAPITSQVHGPCASISAPPTGVPFPLPCAWLCFAVLVTLHWTLQPSSQSALPSRQSSFHPQDTKTSHTLPQAWSPDAAGVPTHGCMPRDTA